MLEWVQIQKISLAHEPFSISFTGEIYRFAALDITCLYTEEQSAPVNNLY